MNNGATYRERLDTDPLTLNQLGAIHREFRRLGFHVSTDRNERLRLTAALAQSPTLASTKDLTMGQAGRAVKALAGCRTLNDLYAQTKAGAVPAAGRSVGQADPVERARLQDV